MARDVDADIYQDQNYQYSAYQGVAQQEQVIEIAPVPGSVAINTINGGGGGSVTGPTITISGGTTGLTFTAAGTTITLLGTLAVASGGTGATTAAGARTNLSVPRMTVAVVPPAVTDDGANNFPVGSLWVDTISGAAYISIDDSTGAAIWVDITA